MIEFTKEKKNDNTGDDLSEGLSKLSIKVSQVLNINDKSYSCEILTFSAWRHPPSKILMSSDVSKAVVLEMLKKDVNIGVKKLDIGRFREQLQKKIQITPYSKIIPAECKPNLLLSICSIFMKHLSSLSNCEINPTELIKSLLEINLIFPRNPLKNMLSRTYPKQWECNALKPFSNGPVLFDRSESYDSDEGTVGMQFERAMIEKGGVQYHRVYALTKAEFGDLRLVLSGELDGVNKHGQPIEIKSKPAWADSSRDIDNWTQSKLCGIEAIVTGSFERVGKAKNGPVTFDSSNIKYETVEQVGSKIQPKLRNQVFAEAYAILNKIVKQVDQVGKVYLISGFGSNPSSVTIRIMDEGAPVFPVTSVSIENIAAVCLEYHRGLTATDPLTSSIPLDSIKLATSTSTDGAAVTSVTKSLTTIV